MKKTVIILSVLALTTCGCGQTNKSNNKQTKEMVDASINNILYENSMIAGDWKINNLIGYNGFEYEYSLEKHNSEFGYGDNVRFSPDSTFFSYYSAPCGNDCFPKTAGTYRFEGENHVRLTLKRITVTGDCPHSDTAMNKDLGLFYIYQDTSRIKLIPSNGNSAEDALNVRYSSIIDAFDAETREVFNLWPISMVAIKSRKVPEIVDEYFQVQKDPVISLKAQDVKILYSKVIRGDRFFVDYFLVVLLEEKQTKQHHILVYSQNSAGLYDPATFQKRYKSERDYG